MNHIPTEVLHEIFIKLTLKDKLQCTLVCRRWLDVLEKRSLLHQLIISTPVFHKLKAMIERQPHRATQVEYLAFQGRYPINFDKRILCNIFPNLREIILSIHLYSRNSPNYSDSPFKFTHPTSKLDKIADSGHCELVPQLAMSNLCTNLKSLELTFLPWSPYDFSQLQNIPVLETFTLCTVKLKLMDLEMIHRNLPSIKRLYLKDAGMPSGEVPRDIIPASLVTEFGLRVSDRIGVESSLIQDGKLSIQLYKYVAKKYPLVRNPAIDHSMLTYTRSEDLLDIYNEGILPLYQNIGPHVDSFYFRNFCEGLDAFRKFDESGIRLKQLTIETMSKNILFLQELVQSQQSKSIQKLTLKNIAPEPLEMLSNMEALRYLEIDCSDEYYFSQQEQDESDLRTIDFNQLVAARPEQLTRLIINGVKLTFDESASNQTSIQFLKLEDVVIISEAATITERSFPKLTTLHLEATVTGNVTISLPQNHLKEVTIHINYPEGEECGLSVNTMCEDRPHSNVIWPTRERGTGGLLYGSNKPNSKSTAKNMVDLTCASIEQMSYSFTQKEVKRCNEEEEEEDDDDYF